MIESHVHPHDLNCIQVKDIGIRRDSLFHGVGRRVKPCSRNREQVLTAHLS